MAKITYQDKPSREWGPTKGKAVTPKTVSAKPLTKEEMEDYVAGKYISASSGFPASGDGYYENGKWVYSSSVSAPSSASVIRLPVVPGGPPSFTPTISTTSNYGRCYETHPAMHLADGFVVYGGSCHSPVVADADIYIALDGGYRHTARHWPWHPTHCQEIEFPIQDMNVPKSTPYFVQLIAWLAFKIREGKKVHVGCIGGHGRTGMVLAALYSAFNPEAKDIIAKVRATYCEKAVESDSQIKFLVDLTGCDTAKGSKSYAASNGNAYGSKKKGKKGKKSDQQELDYYAALAAKNGTTGNIIKPMSSQACLWGPNAAYSN